MAVYYAQYVVPEPAAVSYRPHVATLVTLVERLASLRWIDASWRTVPIVGTEHRSKGARRSLHEDLGVLETLGNPMVIGPFAAPPPRVFWGEDCRRPDGLVRSYDYRDDPMAILKPGYHDELRLIVGNEPCLVPTNTYSEQYPDSEPCPQCGIDLVRPAGSGPDGGRARWFGEAGVDRCLFIPCLQCGAEVPLATLSHLPLFRFALRIDPPPKCTPLDEGGGADPTLLLALEEITGVRFEMVASWS